MSLLAEISAIASAATSVVARRAGLYALIGALFALSLGFAIAAGWSALNALYDPVTASLVIAFGAVILALLIIASDVVAHRARKRARKRRAERVAAQQPPQQPMSPLLMQAFVTAIQVGRSMRS